MSTIYELDNRAAYTLTVGIAPTLNALLNWTARSVRVDNFTNQSVYLDDADSFIPGRSFGVILPIVANRAMASFKAPPFAPDPPAVAGQVCRVTFYELDLTPSPGFTPAANLDLSGADIQPVGQVAAAGSIGLAADAGHVHPGFSWLNVLNVARTPYTADPTGVLDSYATIQQALNDASPKGKVVWLPEGSFLCTVGLKIPSFVMFTGPGTISYSGAAEAITFDANTSYGRVSEIGITCTNAGPNVVGVAINPQGLAVHNNYSNMVDHCFIQANAKVAGQVGVLIRAYDANSASYWNLIESNRILNFSQGVTLNTAQGATPQVNANHITSNRIGNCDFGFNVVAGQENIVSGNSVDNFINGVGVFVQAGNQNQFIGNRFEGGAGSQSLKIAAGVSLTLFIGLDNCPVAPLDNGTNTTIITAQTSKFNGAHVSFPQGLGIESTTHFHLSNANPHLHTISATHFHTVAAVHHHSHQHNGQYQISNTGAASAGTAHTHPYNDPSAGVTGGALTTADNTDVAPGSTDADAPGSTDLTSPKATDTESSNHTHTGY